MYLCSEVFDLQPTGGGLPKIRVRFALAALTSILSLRERRTRKRLVRVRDDKVGDHQRPALEENLTHLSKFSPLQNG